MDQLSNLPLSIKALIGTLAAGCLAGVVYMINPKAIWIVLIGLLIVALIFGLYLLFIHLANKRRAASMGGEISQHSTMAPRGISDPAQRAKLDDLRRKFQEGLAKFRAAGKDLYSVPWYLVIGESGAGKTEAVRHCNVGFPPGLQDEMQGIGGTINMNWWFTNSAVILDTAGKMVFPEVGAATTREWDEFLNLLRKSRKTCPINGLILVLPSDSLIKDNADEVAKKAGRIVDQLNKIQRSLDVRFPVFIIITKCDLINGFREFFNNVTDPRLQHQMLGWSNPGALDDTFRPEAVETHFQSVVSRIRRRRMGLLQDPTPQNDPVNGRRIDEIDALFALPASIELLTPRLRRYLEIVFTPNQWGGKPLFLRGIYFSSAMREGSALDLELAEAIGVPVDSLPEGKAWEKERAYFLRDLFVEKIFKERGLVTGATNTRRMLRRRQAILFGCGFIGLFLLLGFSWIGARALHESVGRESDYWAAASKGWEGNQWRPIVAPRFKGSTDYDFNGAQEVMIGDNPSDKVHLDEYHRRLAELSQSDIRVPWVFKPMNQLVAGANTSRKRAQRIVFECGVVAPLVQAARDKVLQSRDDWTPASSEALAFLIRLESMIANRSAGPTSDDLSSANFLSPLGHFLYGEAKPNADLAAAFDWVYAKGGDGRGYWPPRWLSAGFNLADNHAVNEGLNALGRHALESQKTQTIGFDLIKAAREQLRVLREQEEALTKLASQSAIAGTGFGPDAEAAVSACVRQRAAVEQALAAAAQSGLFQPGQITLFDSYKVLVEESRRQTATAFKLIQKEIETPLTGAVADDYKGPAYTLPGEIRRWLAKLQQDVKSKTEGTFSADELTELQALDRLFLEKTAGGDPLYAVRLQGYEDTLAQMRENGPAVENLVGGFADARRKLESGLNAAREKTARYQGAYAAEFTSVTRRILDAAQTARLRALHERYFAEVSRKLQGAIGFPLVRGANNMPVPGLKDVSVLLRKLQDDVTAIHAGQPPSAVATKADQLEQRVQRLQAILAALLVEEDRPAGVVLRLPDYGAQRRQLMRQLGTEDFAGKFVGNIWRVLRFGSQRVRTEARASTDLARFPASESTLQVDFFRGVDDEAPDKTFAVTAPWAALRLLQEPFARRLEGGRDWEVMISLKDESGTDRYLLLVLSFEKPLPEIDQWPSAEQIAF